MAGTVGTVLVVATLLAMIIVGPLLGSGRSVADHIGAADRREAKMQQAQANGVTEIALTEHFHRFRQAVSRFVQHSPVDAAGRRRHDGRRGSSRPRRASPHGS